MAYFLPYFLILVVLRSELQEYGKLHIVRCPGKHRSKDQHGRLVAQDERGRKNGALAQDASHQACQTLTLPLLEKVNCARRFKGSLISRGFLLRPDDQSSRCARFPCLFPRCLSFILLETFSEAPLKLNARRSRFAAHIHIRINCRTCGGRSMRLERWALPQKRF